MGTSHQTLPISVILIPMVDSICSPDHLVFLGNFSGLVFNLNEIVNGLALKLPSANIAVRIEDKGSDVVLFFCDKRFYDQEMNEIRQEMPVDLYDYQLN